MMIKSSSWVADPPKDELNASPHSTRIGARLRRFRLAKARVDSVTTLHVNGIGGVPATGVDAVTLNVTVDQPEAAGFVTVYPCGQSVPTASNLNYAARQTIANFVTVKVGQDGNVCLYTSGSTHLIADLAACYSRSLPAGFKELEPVRLLDSRNAVGIAGTALLGAGSITTLDLAGRGGIPASGSEAATLNITVTQPQNDGFLTVFPCGQDVPTASNLNMPEGKRLQTWSASNWRLLAPCVSSLRPLHMYSPTSPDTAPPHGTPCGRADSPI
jgi:hypothetical protein